LGFRVYCLGSWIEPHVVVLRDPENTYPFLEIAVLLHLKRVCDRVGEWVRGRVSERASGRVRARE
jgi:hypothetical protein